MKNQAKARQTSLKIAAVAAACAAVALGLQGCGVGDATPPPVVLVPPPVVAAQVTAAKYSVVIRDSATGALVTDATTLTFSGAGVVDSTNAVLTTATTSSGLLALATGAGTNAAATFTVKSQSRAAGWADGQAVVSVFASTDVQIIEISVANANRAAALQASTAPVAAAAASAPATAGQLAAPLVVTTAPKTVTSIISGAPELIAPASLAVPATARLTTAAGVAATGPLTLSVVVPSLATAEGLAAVPGGVSNVKASSGPAGAPITGKLEVAGVAEFTLTDGAGNRITNFSQPVTARIPVKPGTRNATDTGLLAVGDTFPVYVRNETTNQWDFRRLGNVVASGGGLAVEFPTNTFSKWGLMIERTQGAAAVCQSTVTLAGGFGITGSLSVFVNQSGSRLDTAADFAIAVPGQTVGPFTVDRSQGGRVRAHQGAVSFGTVDVQSLCGNIVLPLRNVVPLPGSMVVNMREQCANGTNNRAFSGTVTAFTGNNLPRSASGTGSVTFTGLDAGSYAVTVHPTGAATPLPAQAISIGTGAQAGGTLDVLRTLACGTATGGG